jgi:hypothetical protein
MDELNWRPVLDDPISEDAHSIALAGAKRVRDHALLKAAELDIEVSVVVVNRTGTLYWPKLPTTRLREHRRPRS